MHPRQILKARAKRKKIVIDEDNLTSDDEEEITNIFFNKMYNNRYTIIKYLGRGTFSRLWLVYDIIEGNFKAMKMQNKNDIEEGKNEIKILQNMNHPNIVTLYDHFFSEDYLCLIIELLGGDLFTIQDIFSEKNIPESIIVKIFKEILNGVEHIHSKNIIHTDLKLENILMTQIHPNIKHLIEYFKENLNVNFNDYLEKILPENFKELKNDKRKKLKKKFKIRCASLINVKIKQLMNDYKDVDLQYTEEDFNDIHIKIIDLGNGEHTNDISNDEISYKYYRSPENILGYDYNTKVDIWSLGCIFYEFITRKYLIEIKNYKNDIDRDRQLLLNIQSVIGKIPKNFALNSEYAEELFDKKGRILKYKNNIEDKIIKDELKEFINNEELLEKINDLLMKMIIYTPNNRISAKECLAHNLF